MGYRSLEDSTHTARPSLSMFSSIDLCEERFSGPNKRMCMHMSTEYDIISICMITIGVPLLLLCSVEHSLELYYLGVKYTPQYIMTFMCYCNYFSGIT